MTDPALQDRVRARAYQIFQSRTSPNQSAVSDWLQAEEELAVETRQLPVMSPVQEGWPNVEPILKWGAVAYGLGFLTVALRTRSLGIPVIQLVEAVYILVGFIPAVVLFVFWKWIVPHIKRTYTKVTEVAREAEAQRREMEKGSSLQELYNAIIGAITKVNSFLDPVTNGITILTLVLTREILKRMFNQLFTAQEKRAKVLKFWGTSLSLITKVGAWQAFFNLLLSYAALAGFGVLYIAVLYPKIPQNWGGGAPRTVKLVVNTEKIAPNLKEIQDLFPDETVQKFKSGATRPEDLNPKNVISDKGATGQRKDELKELKSAETNPLDLYYQTEHAYYVKRGTGPIIALEHSAVESIIFCQRDGSQQKCM